MFLEGPVKAGIEGEIVKEDVSMWTGYRVRYASVKMTLRFQDLDPVRICEFYA